MDAKGKAMVGCARRTLRRTARRAREALGTWSPRNPPLQTQAGLGLGPTLSQSARRAGAGTGSWTPTPRLEHWSVGIIWGAG